MGSDVEGEWKWHDGSIETAYFNWATGKPDAYNDAEVCPIKMQLANMRYQYFPSYEKKRIAGKKKVNAFKDGFLILIEMLKLFFKFKVFRNKVIN